MEPEAGRWPEICLPDKGSVGEPTSILPLTTPPLVSPSLSLSRLESFFHHQYPWSFGFPPTFPYQVLEVFHRLIPLSGFLPQSPVIGLGGFSPVTWSFFLRLISFLTRPGCSHWSLVFSFLSPIRVGRFFINWSSWFFSSAPPLGLGGYSST